MGVKNLDTSQYLSLFLEESVENIENLNQSMLELEKGPDNTEIISEIFRYAHTLKGMAATMGFSNISTLTHSMENILDKLRSGELRANRDMVTLLFECVDTLEKMIGDISDGKGEVIDSTPLIERINNIASQKVQESTPQAKGSTELNTYDINIIKEAKLRLYNTYEIEVGLRRDCQLKAARAFLIFNTLQQYGEITRSEPAAEAIEREEFDQTIWLIYVSQREKSFIKGLIDNISEIEYSSVEDMEIDAQSEVAAAAATAAVQSTAAADVAKENRDGAPVKKLGQSVRVDLERLDKFMNLVGELVIHRTRLEQISNSYHLMELNETLEQVGRISSDLQDLVMKVRMIPLDRIFNRLPRMVRDLSAELDKDIDFVIKGQETELDRTVIDELGESIVHLLRNAVDHGIESREERSRTGKDPTGHVTITAYQEGNKAVIKVEDDGRGLDTERIRKKAVSKGINVDGMNDDDIRNLIFLEGFSTSEKVTDISGRGVGMDVVRTKVTSTGGSISVSSEVGKGTTFTVYLPLTLSIIQALLVKVGNETFSISLGFIEKVINVKKGDIEYSNKKEVIVYRDEIIRVVRLDEKLNLGNRQREEEGFIVIVRIGDRHVGLMVESLIGQQEIVIKPLGQSLKGLKEYVGATILGDGRVTLILDVVSIISER
jgi:two-component system chemotaxis sensor kinase CheA